ncbi:MAG: PTS transporter subunit IIC [Christensenellales bacterium]|jgi:uncharacterized membrane protein|nr:PTS sugar transporter subunit IIC [Eubacteriales bacterium]
MDTSEQIEKSALEEKQLGTTKYEIKKFFKKLFKRYLIDGFSGMAQGLFVTLIAGTIIKQLGEQILKIDTGAAQTVGAALVTVGKIASILMGAGIGAGVAKALKGNNLVVFSSMVAGMIGAFATQFMNGSWITVLSNGDFLALKSPGNPVGAYISAVIAAELGILVSGKTPVDILVVPLTVIFSAMVSVFAAWPVIKLIDYIAKGVEIATAATPFVMGIVIAVVMGLILTLPTSSAAMWITIAMTAPTSDAMLIAGGASVVGCAAHMVGFAVASFRENKWGGLIAQGLGTSMLQIPNLMKNPKILIPQIVSSAVVGPLSTTVFMLRCNAAGGGMGTSGLVGVFGTIAASSGKIPDWQMWLGIALLMFVIPAIISLAVSELLRKKNWIKPSDQKIEGIGK